MCFLVGFVLFFNSMNLDTELVVAILGQDSPCESSIFFRFPTLLFCSLPAEPAGWLNLVSSFRSDRETLLLFGGLIDSKQQYNGIIRYEENTQRCLPRPCTSSLGTQDWTSSPRCAFASTIPDAFGSTSNSAWSILLSIRPAGRPYQGNGKSPLFHVLEPSLWCLTSTDFHQEVHDLLHSVHTYWSSLPITSRTFGTRRWKRRKSQWVLQVQRPFVSRTSRNYWPGHLDPLLRIQKPVPRGDLKSAQEVFAWFESFHLCGSVKL